MIGPDLPLMLWIEAFVALGFALAFVIHAAFAFGPEQVRHDRIRVRIGAAIQGLTIGLLIGFVIVPIRMQLMQSAASPEFSSLMFVPALALLILIRRGALLRTPFLSPYLRAYRRAGLLKQRDDALKALERLDAIEARRAPA